MTIEEYDTGFAKIPLTAARQLLSKEKKLERRIKDLEQRMELREPPVSTTRREKQKQPITAATSISTAATSSSSIGLRNRYRFALPCREKEEASHEREREASGGWTKEGRPARSYVVYPGAATAAEKERTGKESERKAKDEREEGEQREDRGQRGEREEREREKETHDLSVRDPDEQERLGLELPPADQFDIREATSTRLFGTTARKASSRLVPQPEGFPPPTVYLRSTSEDAAPAFNTGGSGTLDLKRLTEEEKAKVAAYVPLSSWIVERNTLLC